MQTDDKQMTPNNKVVAEERMVTSPEDSIEHSILPYAGWWPPLIGALSGIVLRIIFHYGHGPRYETMGGTFVFLAPMVVGAVTVYLAERQTRRSWGYYIGAPMLAALIFVCGTLVIAIEGIICAVLAIPLFALLGAVGGLLMGIICRVTHWPKQAAYCFVFTPILIGALPYTQRPENHVSGQERSITIKAPPSAIWQQIHNVKDIQPSEVNKGWMYRIGVPVPIAGVTVQTPTGRERQITMGKGIHFAQVVQDWEEDRFVRWSYRFDDDSFPSGALDDHVKIGGQHFDLIDTSYRLTPIDEHSTQLTIRMTYRVSTAFNWYSNTIARLLIGNFEEVILDFYRNRSAQAKPDV